MRLTRVFVSQPLSPGADVALPDSAAAHLTRVLRLGVGDACIVFNGDGFDYAATLIAVGKREARLSIGGATRVERESPLRITLLQGVARGEKMDLILQKATELGVHRVQPVWSQRSDVKLDGERALKRLEHWRGVVASACEQSGRAVVPEVVEAMSLVKAVDAEPAGVRLLLDPFAGESITSVSISLDAPIVLAIGPEGGWSENDRAALEGAGFIGVRLGPRVLRTETAGLAAIAVLQARFGDLG